MSFTHRTLKNGREVHIGLGTVGCLLPEFTRLFPEYKLPDPYVDREYIPGMRHTVRDQDGNVKDLPCPWPEGDRYLSLAREVGIVTECWKHHVNWAQTLTPPDLQKRLSLAKEAEQKIQSSQG